MKIWQTSRRQIQIEGPLVMAILNVTPDSFSDGGKYVDIGAAMAMATQFVADGADIIDIGGESTRPGSQSVDAATEIDRVVPVIDAIVNRYDIPVSIDTSKAEVARQAVNAGAEIINDISGLRWDAGIADIAAEFNTGLVLMHSRGTFETMHSSPPADDIFADSIDGLAESIDHAKRRGVEPANIVVDVGIGFGKTLEQNLELIAKLEKFVDAFPQFPILVGTSRKSFIAKLCDGVSVDRRLGGSLATALLAVESGADIVRVHDVAETVQALTIADAIWRLR